MRDKVRVGYGKQDHGGFRDRASAGPAAAAPCLKRRGRWRPLLSVKWALSAGAWLPRCAAVCLLACRPISNPDSLWLNEECPLVAVGRCGGSEGRDTCIVRVGGLARCECGRGAVCAQTWVGRVAEVDDGFT